MNDRENLRFKRQIESSLKGKIIGEKPLRFGHIYVLKVGSNQKIVYKYYDIKLYPEKKKILMQEFTKWVLSANRYVAYPIHAKIINNQPFLGMPYYDMDLKEKMLETNELQSLRPFSPIFYLKEKMLGKNIEYNEALVLSCQLIKALIVLKKSGTKHHQDFNPPNILLKQLTEHFDYPKNQPVQYDLLIADFGNADLIQKLGPTRGGGGGKFPFKAPEQYKPKSFSTYNPDTFALGVIIHMLIKGKHPNGISNSKALNKNTSSSKFDKWAFFKKKNIKLGNKNLQKILEEILSEDPKDRPSLHKIQYVFCKELYKKNLFAFKTLQMRFKYYDLHDSYNKHKNEIEKLRKLMAFKEYRPFVFDRALDLLNKQKANINNERDVIIYFDFFEFLFTLNKRLNKLSKNEIVVKIFYALALLNKWGRKLKVIHKYPSVKFYKNELFYVPDTRDFDIASDCLSIIINVLKQYKSINYCEKYISKHQNSYIKSMYYFHIALQKRHKYIYETISYLNKASDLLPGEPIFDYYKYLWIDAFLPNCETIYNCNENELIEIANNALIRAKEKDKEKNWETLHRCELLK